MNTRLATRRIPLTEETHDRLRDFANGASATYDEVIRFFLSRNMNDGENELMAGLRYRDALQDFRTTTQRK